MPQPSPLFSTYRAGENRVTASMAAVFERISLRVLEAVLGGATDEVVSGARVLTAGPPLSTTTELGERTAAR